MAGRASSIKEPLIILKEGEVTNYESSECSSSFALEKVSDDCFRSDDDQMIKRELGNVVALSPKNDFLQYHEDLDLFDPNTITELLNQAASTGSWSCPFCSKVYKARKNLRLHLPNHSDVRNFKCQMCLCAFKKKGHLLQHLESRHSNLGSFICGICSMSFKSLENLLKHEDLHLATESFRCLLCHEVCIVKEELRHHYSQCHFSFHSSSSFFCGICSKTFKSEPLLRTHFIIHSNFRGFKCSQCDKSFKTKHTLNGHLRSHSDDRPYKCQLCGNAFKDRKSYKRHQSTHLKVRPFSCNICQLSFKRKDQVKRHKDLNHH